MLFIVSRNHHLNKMHVNNLALVFGPNVLYQDPSAPAGSDLLALSKNSNNVIGVVSYLIEECEPLFSNTGVTRGRPIAFHARLMGHKERVVHLAQTDDLSLIWSIDAAHMLRLTSAASLLFEAELPLSSPVNAIQPCVVCFRACFFRVFSYRPQTWSAHVARHRRCARSARRTNWRAAANAGRRCGWRSIGCVRRARPPTRARSVAHERRCSVDKNMWVARAGPLVRIDIYDTATFTKFHTATLDTVADGLFVTQLACAGSRMWVCLSDGSVQVLDAAALVVTARAKTAGSALSVVTSGT